VGLGLGVSWGLRVAVGSEVGTGGEDVAVGVSSGGGAVGEKIVVSVGAGVRVGTCSLTPTHRTHPVRLRQDSPSANLRISMRRGEQEACMGGTLRLTTLAWKPGREPHRIRVGAGFSRAGATPVPPGPNPTRIFLVEESPNLPLEAWSRTTPNPCRGRFRSRRSHSCAARAKPD